MIELPGTIAETTPEPDTVATDGVTDDHVPAGVAELKNRLLPAQTAKPPPEVIGAGEAFTVTTTDTGLPPTV